MKKIRNRILSFAMSFLMVISSSLIMQPMTVNAENPDDLSNVVFIEPDSFDSQEAIDEETINGPIVSQNDDDEDTTIHQDDEYDIVSSKDEEETVSLINDEEGNVSGVDESNQDVEDESEAENAKPLPIEVYLNQVKQEVSFYDFNGLFLYVDDVLKNDEEAEIEFKLTDNLIIEDEISKDKTYVEVRKDETYAEESNDETEDVLKEKADDAIIGEETEEENTIETSAIDNSEEEIIRDDSVLKSENEEENPMESTSGKDETKQNESNESGQNEAGESGQDKDALAEYVLCECFDFGDNYRNVSIDLNGNTVFLNDADWYIYAGRIHNGIIDIKKSVEFNSKKRIDTKTSGEVFLEDTILKADSTLAKIYFLDSQNAYKLNNVTFKDMSVEFGETVVESEKDLTLDNTVLKAGGLVLNGGLFVSGESKLYSKEMSVNGIVENEGRIFTDTLIMSENAEAHLNVESILGITKKAVLYNVFLNRNPQASESVKENNALLIAANNAEISINKGFESKENCRLSFMTAETSEDIENAGITRSEFLFTTDITVFPVELIEVIQPEEYGYFNIVSQEEDRIYVQDAILPDEEMNIVKFAPMLRSIIAPPAAPVMLYEQYEEDEPLGTFDTLQEAFKQIDIINNPQKEYIIKIYGDDTTSPGQNLQMPKKAKKITITPFNDGDHICIYSKNTLTLNTDLNLVNVSLKGENTTKININLGGYCLGLVDSDILNAGNITGNGTGISNNAKKINTSGIGLQDSTVNVSGNLNNVKSVSLINYGEDFSVCLTVSGSVNVGEIYCTGSNKICCSATVKSSNGEIISIEPRINVSGNVMGNNTDEDRLALTFKDQNNKEFDISEYSNAQSFMEGTDYRVMKIFGCFKGVYLYYPDSGYVDTYCIKSKGYVIRSSKAPVYFLYDNRGILKCNYIYFEDLVSEINSQKSQERVYNVDVVNDTNYIPEPFTMPSAGNLSSLNFYGDGKSLKYGNYKNGAVTPVNKITLTTGTVFYDVTFINGDENTKTPLSIAMAGNNMSCYETKFLGRAVLIDGGKKGTLVLREDGLYAGQNDGESFANYIEGAITNVAALELDPDYKLTISDYISKVDKDGNPVMAQGALSATEFVGNCNAIKVEGSINLTNVRVLATEKHTYIEATKDFNINGNIEISDSNLVLCGYQKPTKDGTATDKIAPYLNIKGAVKTIYDSKIKIGLKDSDGNFVTPTPEYSVQMLSSAKGTENQFGIIKNAELSRGNNNKYNINVTEMAFNPENDASSRGAEMVKTGNILYAYDGSNIHVTLLKAVPGGDITLAASDERIIGNYPDLNYAVNKINSKNDKSADYIICLLDDIGSSDKPVKVTLPAAKAINSLGIYSCSGDNAKLYYNNSFSFTTDTVIYKAALCPVGNNLDISSPKNTQITVANSELYVKRNLNVWDLEIGQNASVKADGNITVSDTLRMCHDYGYIDGNAMITLNTVEYGDTNEIKYGFINKGTKNEAPGLKIKGCVNHFSGNESVSLKLRIKDVNSVDDILVKKPEGFNKHNYSSLFTPAKLLLNASLLLTCNADIYLGNDSDKLKKEIEFGKPLVVKNGDGFYYIEPELTYFASAILTGSYGENYPGCLFGIERCAYFLDLDKALDQISVFGSAGYKSGQYTILVGVNAKNGVITDTDITDNNLHSGINMPGNNTVHSISLRGSLNSEKRVIKYSGNVTAYAAAGGCIEFDNLILSHVNSGNDNPTENTNINVYRNGNDKTGVVSLNFWNVEEDGESYLNQINGTKGATDVEFGTGCNWHLKTGFSNINRLRINDSEIAVGGNSTIDKLDLSDGGYYSAGGTSAIREVIINSHGYAGAKTASGIKINEEITGDGNLYVYLLRNAKDVNYKNCIENKLQKIVENGKSNYLGVDLIFASKADPSRIKAFWYMNDSDIVPYKNGNFIRNENKNNMNVKIEGNDAGLTFAHDYAEAVTVINNWGKKTDYTVTVLSNDMGTAKGGSYGAFTAPSSAKANLVTIKGNSGLETLKFTGVISPSTNIIFDNIKLTSGTIKNKEFVPSDLISVSMTSDYNITFGRNAASTVLDNNNLRFGRITGSKGKLTIIGRGITLNDNADNLNMKGILEILHDGQNITQKYFIHQKASGKAINIGTLKIDGYTGIMVPNTEAITLNQISGTDGSNDWLFVDAPLAGKNLSTKLKITGKYNLEGLDQIYLVPKTEDGYYSKEQARETSLTRKYAEIPLGPSSMVGLAVYKNDIFEHEPIYITLKKKDKGIYNNGYGIVEVEAYGYNYKSSYLTWEDAVKDIDNLNNKDGNYTIFLNSDLGKTISNQADEKYLLNGLPFPTKAANVKIKPRATNLQDNQEMLIYFKGNSINPKSSVSFVQVHVHGFTYDKSKREYVENDLSITVGNKGGLAFERMARDLNFNNLSADEVVFFQIQEGVSIKANNISTKIMTLVGYRNTNVLRCNNLSVTQEALFERAGIEAQKVSIKNADMVSSGIIADNISLTGTAKINSNYTRKCWLEAKQITTENIILKDMCNVKLPLDKNHNSPFTVKGTIEEEGSDVYFIMDLLDSEGNLPDLKKGNRIATAPKTDCYFFQVNNRILGKNPAFFKSGNTIILDEYDCSESVSVYTDGKERSNFKNFNSAVKDIDSRNNPNEDYIIYLPSDEEYEIKSSNGQYAPLVLPSKAKSVTIRGAALKFSGNITLKTNLIFDVYCLLPVKPSKVKGSDVESFCDINTGGYELRFRDVYVPINEDGSCSIRNISGNRNGKIVLESRSAGSSYRITVKQVTGVETVKYVNGNETLYVREKSSIKNYE